MSEGFVAPEADRVQGAGEGGFVAPPEQRVRQPLPAGSRHSVMREADPLYRPTMGERVLLGVQPALQAAGGIAGATVAEALAVRADPTLLSPTRWKELFAVGATGGALGAEGGKQAGELIEDAYYHSFGRSVGERALDVAVDVPTDIATSGIFSAAGRGLRGLASRGIKGTLTSPEGMEMGQMLRREKLLPETGSEGNLLGMVFSRKDPRTGLGPLVYGKTGQMMAELQKRLPIISGVWHQALDQSEDVISREQAKLHMQVGRGREFSEAQAVAEKALGRSAKPGVEPVAGAVFEHMTALADDKYLQVKGLYEMPVDYSDVKQWAMGKLKILQAQSVTSPGRAENIKLMEEILGKGAKPAEAAQMLQKINQSTGADAFHLSLGMKNSEPFWDAKEYRSSLLAKARGTQSPASMSQEAADVIDHAMDKSAAKSLAPAEYKAWRAGNAIWRDMKQSQAFAQSFMEGNFAQKLQRDVVGGVQGTEERLKFLKKMLTKEQMGEINSTLHYQMGLESKGAAEGSARMFDPVAYKRNYVNARPEVLDEIYGKVGTPLRDATERWVKIGGAIEHTGSLKEGKGVWWVAGGVEATVAAAGYLAAGSPGAAASALFMPTAGYMSAKLMTNARFVNWLVDGAKPSAMTAAGFAAHMARLGPIYTEEVALRGALSDYIESRRKMFPRNQQEAEKGRR